ncbi:MAG: hypothetical protein ACREBM_08985 [Sphingomicrobium sp.]
MTQAGETTSLSFARDHSLPGKANRLHGLVLEIATPPPRIA